MKLTITMSLDNDAFSGDQLGYETAIILRMLADKIADLNTHDATREAEKGNSLILKDTNGNNIGKAFFTL